MGFFDRLASQVVGGSADKDTADLQSLAGAKALQGDDEGAVVALGQVVSRDPAAMDAWLELGEALARLGRREPAEDALRRVLVGARDDDRRARAHAARGRMAIAGDQRGRAVRELRRTVDLVPEDAASLAALGRILHNDGDPEGALWLQRAALLDAAWVLEAADVQNDSQVAESLLNQGLVAADGIARVQIQAALALLAARGGLGDKAVAQAQTALASAPEDPRVQVSHLAVLEATGHWDAAFAAGLRLIASGLKPPPQLLRLALGAVGQGQDPRALIERMPNGDDRNLLDKALLGQADETTRLRLMHLSPTQAGRAQVALWGAPGPVPTGQILGLLGYARDLAMRVSTFATLLPDASDAVAAFDRPLMVAVMGEFNAGKSSFVNALIGADVAPVGITPTTATINVFSYGSPGARVRYHDGRVEDLALGEVRDFLTQIDEPKAGAIRTVDIFVQADVLRHMQIVDTPGYNSLQAAHEKVARAFMTDADALVWVFAAGQAAKATERTALEHARAARKRVLGIVNKVDQIEPDDLAAVMDAVRRATGDVVEVLLPLCTRPQDAAGLQAVHAAIETRFFTEARRLKQQTALHSLRKFVQQAKALALSELESGDKDERRHFDALAEMYGSAMARARISLPARVETDLRRAADDLRDGLRSRDLMADPGARMADEAWWATVFEDVLQDAVEDAAVALVAAVGPDEVRTVEIQVAAFQAFVRGLLAGGLAARSLAEDFPLVGRPDRASFARALAARAPSVLTEFLDPVDRAMQAVFLHQRQLRDLAAADQEARLLLRDETLRKPIEALGRAIAAFDP